MMNKAYFNKSGLLIVLLLLAGFVLATRGEGEPLKPDAEKMPRLVRPGRWKNLGVAVPMAPCLGAVATVNASGERLVGVLYEGGVQVVNVDRGTEANRPEPDLPGSRRMGYVYFLSRKNRLYLTAHAHLLEFDLEKLEWSARVPIPAPEAMSFTEGSDGTIYLGLYPNSELLAFDPERKTVRTLTTLKKAQWPVYVRRLAMDDNGWIYAAIAHAEATLIAYHPSTGEKRDLFPGNTIRQQFPDAHYWEGSGSLGATEAGAVAATPVAEGETGYFRNGERVSFAEPPGKRPREAQMAIRQLCRSFPDGSRIEQFSYEDGKLSVRLADTGETRNLKMETPKPGPGLRIYSLAKGPDGAIHGSTGLPLRWFRFDPGAGTFRHYGHSETTASGHVNRMIPCGNTIYGCIYSGGLLIGYRPDRPWQAPFTKEGNPALLADALTINRPHALAVFNGGKTLVMGGTPPYGKRAGGLLFLDLETGRNEEISASQLLPVPQSTYQLLALRSGAVLGGTTVAPGTGGITTAESAMIYRLNQNTRRVEKAVTPIANAGEIRALAEGGDGCVYGFARVLQKPDDWRLARAGKAIFFAFDPDAMQVIYQEDLSQYGALAGIQAPQVLADAGNGRFLAIFEHAIVEIDPARRTHRRLSETPVTLTEGAVVAENQLFVAAERSLWVYGLPDAAAEPPPSTSKPTNP